MCSFIFCSYGQKLEYTIKNDIANLYSKEEVAKSLQETLVMYNKYKKDSDTAQIFRIIPIYNYSYDYEGTRMNVFEQLEYLEQHHLEDIPFCKSEFLDNSYYSKLLPNEYKVRKNNEEFIDIDFYLIDAQNKVIGYGNPLEFYITQGYSNLVKTRHQSLIDNIDKLCITDLFVIKNITNWPIFGKTLNNEIYIFGKNGSNGARIVSTLKEYIDTHPNIFK